LRGTTVDQFTYLDGISAIIIETGGYNVRFGRILEQVLRYSTMTDMQKNEYTRQFKEAKENFINALASGDPAKLKEAQLQVLNVAIQGLGQLENVDPKVIKIKQAIEEMKKKLEESDKPLRVGKLKDWDTSKDKLWKEDKLEDTDKDKEEWDKEKEPPTTVQTTTTSTTTTTTTSSTTTSTTTTCTAT